MKRGRSMLLLGPSGAGKSSTLRQALVAEGSGIALLAPGHEEASSYAGLDESDDYRVIGCSDAEFQPLLDQREAKGFREALSKLSGLYAMARFDLGLVFDATAATRLREAFQREPLGRLKYQVLAVDTISGIGDLAVNQLMSAMGIDMTPPPKSPDGARFYSTLTQSMKHFTAAVDGLRGMGMDVLVAAHVVEREQSKAASAEQLGKMTWVAAMLGSFRETLPRGFDLVMYSGVDADNELVNGQNNLKHPRHYLQWLPDTKRPTKSRVGVLDANERIPNDWVGLRDRYDAAFAKLEASNRKQG